jgi:hypothetical protein
MTGDDLVRAWKDPEERDAVAHPSGDVDLDLTGALASPFNPIIDFLKSWLLPCGGPEPFQPPF